ncbi:MAG: WecB/TagA/CpsF family glycosyl transferase [Chloroflexota bacterium]|nr:WecB/TagA/CpsF family glycosyltransferase [Caldilinea sp.]GIK75080.1 MAG: WecB/TagA/CpsF family glycosyl transferase [Chloroflexota bacterium]
MNDFCFSQTQILNILGVEIDRVDFALTLDLIDAWVMQRRAACTVLPPCRQICTVNPEFIVDAQRDPNFAAVLARADLCVPDGAGVLWAARRVGLPLRERVTGSDGIYRICERAATRGWRVFLLGAAPGVAERTAAVLTGRYPGLMVAGCYAGSPADDEWLAIRARLDAAAPDILFVAYGHPRQDFWIDRHRAQLPTAVAIGVGGAFDFVAGVAQRAPLWMQRFNLEWLHRLITQPWRWRRMLKLPVFVALTLLQDKGEQA